MSRATLRFGVVVSLIPVTAGQGRVTSCAREAREIPNSKSQIPNKLQFYSDSNRELELAAHELRVAGYGLRVAPRPARSEAEDACRESAKSEGRMTNGMALKEGGVRADR